MIAGLIVAGGKSKRFGSDKRFFQLNGKTLFEIAYERIGNVCETTYVVLDKYTSADHINLDRFIIIRDLEEGKGPLMGIYSALSKIDEEGCLVIPVDMPELNDSLLNHIKQQAHFYDLVILFGKQPLPLPGFYSRKLLPYMKAAIEVGDLSIKSLVAQAEGSGKLKVLRLSLDDIKKFGDPEQVLLNINRKEEIKVRT